MKFLVITGAPDVTIPGLSLSIRAQESWFSVNPVDVMSRLLEAGHEVTLLSLDPIHDKNLDNEKLTYLECADFVGLIAKLKYLAKEVEYDTILSFVKLPVWQYQGLYSSHNDLDEENMLYKSDDRLTQFEYDPLLRFECLNNDDMLAYTDVVYGLRGNGCTASVICLEAIPRVAEHATPHDLIHDRLERIREKHVTVAVLDDVEQEVARRGAYVVGKNGGNPIHHSRMSEYLVSATLEAGEISREERGLTDGKETNQIEAAPNETTSK